VGLTNIKTRASLFDGKVKIFAAPGKGCELKVLFANYTKQVL
jgi:signal transduction histidine kinase